MCDAMSKFIQDKTRNERHEKRAGSEAIASLRKHQRGLRQTLLKDRKAVDVDKVIEAFNWKKTEEKGELDLLSHIPTDRRVFSAPRPKGSRGQSVRQRILFKVTEKLHSMGHAKVTPRIHR